MAVGMFNRAPVESEVEVRWDELDLSGPLEVRDLWRHMDLGTSTGQFSAMVPRHGVALVRIG